MLLLAHNYSCRFYQYFRENKFGCLVTATIRQTRRVWKAWAIIHREASPVTSIHSKIVLDILVLWLLFKFNVLRVSKRNFFGFLFNRIICCCYSESYHKHRMPCLGQKYPLQRKSAGSSRIDSFRTDDRLNLFVLELYF